MAKAPPFTKKEDPAGKVTDESKAKSLPPWMKSKAKAKKAKGKK